MFFRVPSSSVPAGKSDYVHYPADANVGQTIPKNAGGDGNE